MGKLIAYKNNENALHSPEFRFYFQAFQLY